MMQERDSHVMPMASGQRLKTKTHQVEWSVGPIITVTDTQDADKGGEDVSIKRVGETLFNVLFSGSLI